MDMHDFAKGKAWAILPNALDVMIRNMRDLAQVKGLDAQMARFTTDPRERDDFLLRDGVAIIPVTGPISKRGSFYSFLYGGTPLAVLTEVFMDALADRDVQAIVLDIDSPGGTVAGTEAFGNIVYESRGIKPVVAFGGMMASAAYWIGSGADKVVVESTADVGSVGVVMMHCDWSEEDKKIGLKRTVLTAGKYKGLGNDAEPLSDLARDTFQAELDYIYTIFVDTVARNRGVSADVVLKDMADGRVFIGQQAVDCGLADSIGSLDSAVALAASLAESQVRSKYFISGTNPGKESNMSGKTGEAPMNTVEQLTAAFPELMAQANEQAVKSVDVDAVRTEAATAERERIMGLASIQFGDETGAAFAEVVNAGVTVDQFKAIRGTAIVSAQTNAQKAIDQAKEETLAAIQGAGADNPGAGGGDDGEAGGFMELVEAYKTANKCSRTEALKAVAASNPQEHEAYLSKMMPKKA